MSESERDELPTVRKPWSAPRVILAQVRGQTVKSTSGSVHGELHLPTSPSYDS